MSEFRNTALILVVFAALYGYIAIYESDEKDDLDKPARITRLEKSDIDWVSLETPAGTVTLERTAPEGKSLGKAAEEKPAEGFKLRIGDKAFEADPGPVETLLGRLASVEVQRTVELEAKDPATYELDKPSAKVRWKAPRAKDPFKEGSLEVGGKSPVGPLKYLRLGGAGAVYAANSWDLDILSKDATHFREKRILRVETDKIASVEVTRKTTGGAELRRFEKQGDAWRITKPASYPADASEVRMLLSDLTALRSQAFLSEEASAVATYGLADPETQVELAAADGATWVLKVGARDPEKPTWSRAQVGTAQPAAVEQDLLRRLTAPLNDFREKKVFAAAAEGATAMMITSGTTTFALEKAGEKWRLTSHAGLDATTAAGDLLDELEGVRASGFIDTAPKPEDTGLATPAYAITLRRSAGTVAASVGKPPSGSVAHVQLDAGLPVYITPAGWLDQVGKIWGRIEELARKGSGDGKS